MPCLRRDEAALSGIDGGARDAWLSGFARRPSGGSGRDWPSSLLLPAPALPVRGEGPGRAAYWSVSVVRPDAGLLAFAGLAPLSSAIAGSVWRWRLAGSLNCSNRWRSRSEQECWCGACRRRLERASARQHSCWQSWPSPRRRHCFRRRPRRLTRSFADGALLGQLALRQSGAVFAAGAPLFAALLIAECGLLGWAVERIVRQTPHLAHAARRDRRWWGTRARRS